mgnify:CR=1 FL=1
MGGPGAILAIKDISSRIAKIADYLASQAAVDGDIKPDSFAEEVNELAASVNNAPGIYEPHEKAAILAALSSFAKQKELSALLRPIETLLRKLFSVYDVVGILKANYDYLEPETAYLMRRLIGQVPAQVVFAPGGTFLQRSTAWATLGTASISGGELTYTQDATIPTSDYAGAKVMLVVNSQGANDTVLRITAKKFDGATDTIQKTIPGGTSSGDFEFLSETMLYVAIESVELVSGGNDGDSYSFQSRRWREMGGIS